MSQDKDITFDHLGNYGNVFFQYAYMRKVADDYGYIPVLPEWNISHWHMCDPGFFDEFIELKRRYEVISTVFLNEYLNTDNNHHTYLSDSENIGNDKWDKNYRTSRNANLLYLRYMGYPLKKWFNSYKEMNKSTKHRNKFLLT